MAPMSRAVLRVSQLLCLLCGSAAMTDIDVLTAGMEIWKPDDEALQLVRHQLSDFYMKYNSTNVSPGGPRLTKKAGPAAHFSHAHGGNPDAPAPGRPLDVRRPLHRRCGAWITW